MIWHRLVVHQQGQSSGKSKKNKKKKNSKKKQAAGDWQGQEGQDTGKDSITSALEDDSCTGFSGGNTAEVPDNQDDEENPENPPTLEEVRAFLAHRQGAPDRLQILLKRFLKGCVTDGAAE